MEPSPTRRTPLWLPVGAIVYLALLCANTWIAPRNDLLWSTFERFDVTGKVVTVAIAAGYVLASLAVIALFWRSARRRSPTPDVRQDARDAASLIAILSTGSLVPMTIAALMRTDSGVPGAAGAPGPVIGETIILMIAIAALAIAGVLTIASRGPRSTSA